VNQTIGINLGHNSSAVLVIDDVQVLRLEEEKIVQKKGYFGFPHESVKQIEKLIDLDSNVQIVIGHTNIYEIFSCHRILIKFCGLEAKKEYFYYFFDLYKFIFPKSKLLRKTIRLHLEMNLKSKSKIFKNIKYLDHHDSHAHSALYDSGFDNCLALTRDGKGDFCSGKNYIYKDGILNEIGSLSYLESYGLVYSAATKALGFKMLRHEGKITGLAALGDPNKLSEAIIAHYFKKEFDKFETSFQYVVKSSSLKAFIGNRFIDYEINKYSSLLSSWIRYFELLILEGNSSEDIAAGVQKFLETLVVKEINDLLVSFKIPKDIALAGGIFANVKLNQKIWEIGYFDRMFVQPAMDDAGTALGAASSNVMNHQTEPTLNDIVYLGSFNAPLVLNELPPYFKVELIENSEVGLLVSNLILSGKIIGTFAGRTEWGPRALGNRSILASAFDKSIPKKLNERLNRNDFMPFAPIIRDIDAPIVFQDYTSGLIAARFMTVTLKVKSDFKNLIPSVIHVDGTARPQVLFKEDNPLIYNVLDSISRKHGIGIILNTSFNLHEYPILDSISTALEILKKGAVDYLLIEGRYLISVQ
jgi:carbamoyltransferase